MTSIIIGTFDESASITDGNKQLKSDFEVSITTDLSPMALV